ncbi:MAG: hypothetical protein H7Y22_07835, partial [Gemmatimonadaceae bacterium]|nr:hypothetical protein [Gloeobacterales cyanobacterium ES-bin-141]
MNNKLVGLLVGMALLMGAVAQSSTAQTSDTNAGSTQGQSKGEADVMRQKQLESDNRAKQHRTDSGTDGQVEGNNQVTNAGSTQGQSMGEADVMRQM